MRVRIAGRLPEQKETSGGRADAEDFSGREKDVLRLLLQGHANADIALRLDVPEAVVRGALRTIYRKLDVRNRTQAAIWAIQHLARPPVPLASTPDPISFDISLRPDCD